jgi:hypothetical protein
MKIDRNPIPETTIELLACMNDLTMVVCERPVHIGAPNRFYAHFKNAEVKGDGVLVGSYGDGATEEDAIKAYAREISEKRLVINAFSADRKEIDVPRLTEVEQ